MNKIKHVMGISGGKDSAALAIYVNDRYPQLDMTYYFCDTGKELDETYQLVENLKIYLGKDIQKLEAIEPTLAGKNPFDFYYDAFRGYLPSSMARWCTKYMKLEPFERFVGDDPVVSYVGIRGDEDREGYISKKSNIQSIFPFRKNIWSEDVIAKVLHNDQMTHVADLYSSMLSGPGLDRVAAIVLEPYTVDKFSKDITRRNLREKLNNLLNTGVAPFNRVVFNYLKQTAYPLATEADYPLLENEDVLVRADIFHILEESGVGVPGYYRKMEYEVEGQKGKYARSRSGCYFCFFQQKIEWVWLYEQHPGLFQKAMAYENEKEGFTWNANQESLKDLIRPNRILQIKKEHLHRISQEKNADSEFLLDILDATEGEGCAACFI